MPFRVTCSNIQNSLRLQVPVFYETWLSRMAFQMEKVSRTRSKVHYELGYVGTLDHFCILDTFTSFLLL